MRVQGLRGQIRTRPPFAPADVHYTEKLASSVNVLSRVLTISAVAAGTEWRWNTGKDIVQARLQKDAGPLPLRALKRLSLEELSVGQRKQYYTVVLDLESGRIVWVRRGRGKAALQRLLAAFAPAPGEDRGGGEGPGRSLLGRGHGRLAQGESGG